ncbi:MAG: alpha-glucuronidase family glycosyl hydrolase [Mariniphaga sp.]
MIEKRTILIGISIILILLSFNGFAKQLDLSGSKILCFEKKDPVVLKAVTVLQEEIRKRSGALLPVITKLTGTPQTIIAVGQESDLPKLPENFRSAISKMEPIGKDGYQIAVLEDSKTILVIGHDPRGVLYGIGKLLRNLEIHPGRILIDNNFKVASAPKYPIRGHQLGYRPKTNAYDAWTVDQFDSYIRDLVLFGANSIEIMPPRTDDDPTSVNMKLPSIQMMTEQSRICKEYGLDVWMWYPNMGSDYTTEDSINVELAEREKVFSVLPKLDALFVPAGDPGDLEPDELFNWLEREAVVLHKYHPNAKIWVSPQVFKPSAEWYRKFYAHVNKEYNWFGGIVYGPWIKTPLPEVKKLIKPSIAIRLYPDITHSLSCQYPIPDWDIAYAMTLGRECINPRPEDEKYIHNFYANLAQGSISYSEGTNDDVNKFVWSGQDWDPSTPVIETLRDYARYFIGSEYTENVAQGLMSLERNIKGRLLTNEQVQRTLQQWQDMEQNAPVNVLSNPRFQSGLIRAYFDAYTQRRLVYETNLEFQARDILENAKTKGSNSAISEARNILSLAIEKPASPELKGRCIALADSLFRSFGAQLTVAKHHAMSGRGNFIDNIDVPLNDALWILDQLKEVEKLNSEPERLAAIEKMLHRTDPGPGGFYDNFGNPAAWKRIKARKSWAQDPGSLESPRESFGVGLTGVDWVHEVVAKGFEGQTTPLAWMNQINTLYDTPLEMEYDNLDPNSEYMLKIAYTGRFRSSMKLMADGVMIHNYIRMGTRPLFEFPIPKEVTKDGKVSFTWTCGQEDKGEGERGSQVAEIWIIKKQ